MKKSFHFFVWTVFFTLMSGVSSLYAQGQPPNIIYILVDDLGYGHLGSYGQQDILTPELDTMAAEGVRFTDAYAGSTVCAPSRSVLMTGQHTGHTRIRVNGGGVPLAPEDITVAEVLKNAGYTTGLVGKWGLGELGSTGVPNAQGFDYFYGYLNQTHAHDYYTEYLYRNDEQITLTGNLNGQQGEYTHDLFTQEAKNFITTNQVDPFFLYIAYTIPHADTGAGTNPVPSQGIYAGMSWPEEQKNVAAMITRMDKDVGEILDLLQAYGIDNNTIVFFASDNGPHAAGGHDPSYHNSSGPLRGIKRDLYDGGIRTPLIVRWPGTIEAGGVSSLPTAFWDFLPTAAEIAGEAVPEGVDGISILPELLGNTQVTHDYLYWESPGFFFIQAVRKGNWKGVRFGAPYLTELYDLSVDIGETNNLAGDNPTIVSEIETIFVNARTNPNPDSDDDGVPDTDDEYPYISLEGRLDTDQDGIPNDCDAACIDLGMSADLDDDGDEEIDTVDNCPLTVNPLQEDIDLDGIGDHCDNCQADSNPNQADKDGDGIGNACDPDFVPSGC